MQLKVIIKIKSESYVNTFGKYWQYFKKVSMSFKLLRKDKFCIIYHSQRKQKTWLVKHSVLARYMESSSSNWNRKHVTKFDCCSGLQWVWRNRNSLLSIPFVVFTVNDAGKGAKDRQYFVLTSISKTSSLKKWIMVFLCG